MNYNYVTINTPKSFDLSQLNLSKSKIEKAKFLIHQINFFTKRYGFFKIYKKAYYEALREASASLASLNYKYVGPATVATTTQEIKPLTSSPAATPVPVNVEGQLFAQPIANGYQLVDTTPKVVAKMYKTSQQDYYTAQGDNKNGVIFKKGNDWFFEYYQNDKLVSEKLSIKF